MMRILFAEDDRDLNNAVKTLLTRSGYQVDAVFDGEDALSYAQAESYDGIILDTVIQTFAHMSTEEKISL